MKKALFLVVAVVLAVTRPASANSNYIGVSSLLSANNSVLMLIDHQPFQFADVHSHDPTEIINSVVGLAKTAKIFGVPTILTTVLQGRGGYLIPQIQNEFPNQQPINRTTINAWEDVRVVAAVRATGRKQLIIAGLWTEISVAMPTLSALGDGYDVFFVTDASGGKTKEAHKMSVLRMTQAGAVPITWFAVLHELQRDWARPTQEAVLDVVEYHGGGSSVALAWELQLLQSSNSNTNGASSTGSNGASSTGNSGR